MSWIIWVLIMIPYVVGAFHTTFFGLPWWFCMVTGFLVGGGAMVYAEIILELIQHLVRRLKFKMIIRKLIKEINRGKK